MEAERAGGDHRQLGRTWWEYNRFLKHRFSVPYSIGFAFVATHNHFVLDRGGKIFHGSAPVIKLPKSATEEQHIGLLALLNSSVGCFWMKQTFHNKGGEVSEGVLLPRSGNSSTNSTALRFANFRCPKIVPRILRSYADCRWARVCRPSTEQGHSSGDVGWRLARYGEAAVIGTSDADDKPSRGVGLAML